MQATIEAMAPLAVSCVLGAFLAMLVMFGLTGAAAAIRVLPWLMAPDVPVALTLPFLRALVATALEVAVLVGLPVGCALGAARFVARGEALALFALGVGPGRLVRQLLVPLGVLGALAHALHVRGEPPGQLASRLIEAGRGTCAQVPVERVVEVPILGMTWLCSPNGPSRIAGRVPGISSEVWFTARGLSPSDDLKTIELSGLALATPKEPGRLQLRLRAEEARLSNMRAWGAPPTLGAGLRAAIVAASAVLGALALAWQVLRRSIDRPVLAGALAAVAAVLALALLKGLDRQDAAAAAYSAVGGVLAGVPLAGGRLAVALGAKMDVWLSALPWGGLRDRGSVARRRPG